LYARGEYGQAGRRAEEAYRSGHGSQGEEVRDAALALGIFAYAKAGETDHAWRLIEAVPESHATYLDVAYAGCYLAYQRGEYEAVEYWGRSYLDCHARLAPDAAHAETRDKLHEVLNTLGCAAKDRGQDTRALEYFTRVTTLRPDYPLAYLNAAQICRRAGDTDRAREFIRNGLSRCTEVEALRTLERTLAARCRISLCMIVRDEEEMLAGALESARPAVDEIVVVDTGSSDRTVRIAESHGARVYHHRWEDDFARARNQSIDHATGDWIVILDADERFDRNSAPLIRKLAQTCEQEAIAFSVYNVDLDGGETSFMPSIRMFRNGRGYGFEGIVHNQINIPKGTTVMRAPVRIDHYGYTPSIVRRRHKVERTTSLLQRQLDLDPDDAFAHFNMAQIVRAEAADASDYQKVVRHAQRVVELISPQDTEHLPVLLMAQHQLATSYLALERFATAEAACRAALAIRPDYIDALMTLAQSLTRRGRFVEARASFRQYLRARAGYDEAQEAGGFILLSLHAQHEAYYGLAVCEEALGDHATAMRWFRKTLMCRDDYLDAHERLTRLRAEQGSFGTERDSPAHMAGVGAPPPEYPAKLPLSVSA